MTAPRAADLPVGSLVQSASSERIAVKKGDDPGPVWGVAGIGPFWSYEIDVWLARGAQVLRVGDRSDQ